jgi:hypothetical protein
MYDIPTSALATSMRVASVRACASRIACHGDKQ